MRTGPTGPIIGYGWFNWTKVGGLSNPTLVGNDGVVLLPNKTYYLQFTKDILVVIPLRVQ